MTIKMSEIPEAKALTVDYEGVRHLLTKLIPADRVTVDMVRAECLDAYEMLVSALVYQREKSKTVSWPDGWLEAAWDRWAPLLAKEYRPTRMRHAHLRVREILPEVPVKATLWRASYYSETRDQ